MKRSLIVILFLNLITLLSPVALAIGSLQQNLMRNEWSRHKGLGVAGGESRGFGITIDNQGNVFVVGTTLAGLDGNTLSFAGSTDTFVTKYSRSGVKLWTKQFGCTVSCSGTTQTYGNGITSDVFGNIYVTGSTKAPTVGVDALSYSKVGSQDVYVLKLNSAGTAQWMDGFGAATKISDSQAITIDPANSFIYITGKGLGSLPGNTVVGNQDPMIAQYTFSGTRNWIKQFGVSGGTTLSYGVAVDSTGKIYIGGSTNAALPGNSQTGTADIWIAQYSSNGTRNWISQIGNAGGTANFFTYGNPIAVSSSDAVFITGFINSDLDGQTFSGTQNLFLIKYNTSGVKQATILKGTNHIRGLGLAADRLGNIYVTGDALDLTMDGVARVGDRDAYILSYDSNLNHRWTRRVGSTFGGVRQTFGTSLGVSYDGDIFLTGYVQAAGAIFDTNYTVIGTYDMITVKYNRDGVKRGP